MKRYFLISLMLAFGLASILTGCKKPETDPFVEFESKLKKLPQVVSVAKEETADFKAKYKVFFEQPIDHDDASVGTYKQLVYVFLNHPDSINVLVTEGYHAFDAQRVSELVPMFHGNQIVVEHRYYGESKIDDDTYRYMNADNSCDDLHEVVTSLKQLLSGKWISTGVSKSGLTCNMYRAWYPNDVDVTVPYSSPFCIGRYDDRAAHAIAETVGTPEDRAKMTAFLRELLNRRDAMVPKFDSLAALQNIEFHIPAEKLWDLHIMDYRFAFWSYSHNINDIPALDASDDEIFNYIINIDGPDAWDWNYEPCQYYIQAYMELGHCQFCTAGLEDLLIVDDYILDDYLKYVYVPEPVGDNFSTAMHEKVDDFLRNTDAKYMFLYGSYDPWLYVGIGEEYVNGDNIVHYVLPGGGHGTKIANFDAATQKEIKDKLNEWLR